MPTINGFRAPQLALPMLLFGQVLAGSSAVPPAIPVMADQSISSVAACAELDETVVNEVNNDRARNVLGRLAPQLAGRTSFERICGGTILTDIAALLAARGRLAEAETLARHGVETIRREALTNASLLLVPLSILATVQIEERKITAARAVVMEMQALPADSPIHHALVHQLSGRLLAVEKRTAEAVSEYMAAFEAWKQSGSDRKMAACDVLHEMSILSLQDGRLDDALSLVNQALEIISSLPAALVADRAKLLNLRGIVHIRQHDTSGAEVDFLEAISITEHDAQSDPSILAALLANYAHLLRKTHRKREARAMEQRVKAMPSRAARDLLIDVSTLRRKR